MRDSRIRARSRLALLSLAVFGWGCLSLRPCPDPGVPPAPFDPADIDATVFFLGDAGDPIYREEPALITLRSELEEAVRALGDERVRVLFLGDNIYPNGLPEASRDDYVVYRARLDESVEVFAGLGQPSHPVGIFLPGNHDWNGSKADGLERLRRQETYLATAGGGRVEMLPGHGCPGPEVLDLGDRLRIVILDTHWWLRDGVKPEGPDSGCAAGSEEEVTELLRRHLEEAGPRRVLVAAHHPLSSGGRHGGHTNLLWRLAGRQNLSSSAYRHLIRELKGAFAARPPLVYASGHEHNLQLLRGLEYAFQAISGAGTRAVVTELSSIDDTVFCRQASGFMRLDVARDGRVRLAAWAAGRDTASEVFATFLEESASPGDS